MPTSFGFEYELDAGAPELVQWLYSTHPSHIGSNELHSYHCDCDTCDTDEYVFRAQRDSSCSGEIISSVFLDIGDPRESAFPVLEEGSLAVDAEPGPNSGFHVHVGIGDHQTRYTQPTQYLADAYFEFVRWEQVIATIAAGRFQYNRGNNTPTESIAHGFLINLDNDYPWVHQERTIYDMSQDRYVDNPRWNPGRQQYNTAEILRMVREHDDADSLKMELLTYSMGQDRHSNLATQTRHNTWEFRVFNSTRAAWRMELWCEMARAFMDDLFVGALTDADRITHANFAAALGQYNSNAAALCERQVHYVNTQDWDSLPNFTAA
jgi:hypothetical protein